MAVVARLRSIKKFFRGLFCSANSSTTGNEAPDEVKLEVNTLPPPQPKNALHEVLPEEIWEMIINMLRNPSDRHNALLALPELSYELHHKKRIWLFGQVLPLLSNYLRTEDLVALHGVCRRWDLDMHDAVVNHPFGIPYNENPKLGQINTRVVTQKSPLLDLSAARPVLTFRTVEALSSFLSTAPYTHYHRGPIFGKVVCFDPLPGVDREQFLRYSFEMLTVYGSEIQHAILHSDRDFENALQCYNRFRQYLELMPNLTRLSVSLEKQVDANHLSLVILKRPLPPLRKLEYLRYEFNSYHHGDGTLPLNIADAILSYVYHPGSKIRKLSVTNALFEGFRHKPVCLSTLTDLEILPSMGYTSFFLTDKLMSHASDNLQKITLHYEDFPMFARHCDRLPIRVLCLEGNACWLKGEEPITPPKMPNLHTIELHDSCCSNYSFFLHLKKNLRTLNLWKDDVNDLPLSLHGRMRRNKKIKNPEHRFVTTQVRKWLRKAPVRRSEIWNLLPALQEIRIHKKGESGVWMPANTYTREKYAPVAKKIRKNKK